MTTTKKEYKGLIGGSGNDDKEEEADWHLQWQQRQRSRMKWLIGSCSGNDDKVGKADWWQ